MERRQRQIVSHINNIPEVEHSPHPSHCSHGQAELSLSALSVTCNSISMATTAACLLLVTRRLLAEGTAAASIVPISTFISIQIHSRSPCNPGPAKGIPHALRSASSLFPPSACSHLKGGEVRVLQSSIHIECPFTVALESECHSQLGCTNQTWFISCCIYPLIKYITMIALYIF